MFYSESLLLKTGPLARVWLASNLDRKLNKNQVLQSNLQENVKNIIGEDAAPIALRMSGQLLLGCVKIYNRKAKYLMDDCGEVLLKVKMAYRPGNVDLPSDQSHRANPGALMLPDTITELDLLAPLPDPEDLLREPEARLGGHDPTLLAELDFGMSQVMDSQTPVRTQQKRTFNMEIDDLGLDLGDLDDPIDNTDLSRSIEAGRNAPTPLPDRSTLILEKDDLGLDLGLDDTTGRPGLNFGDDNGPLPNFDDDVPMGGMDNEEIGAANRAALLRAEQASGARRRDSQSPLSSVRGSQERDLEQSYRLDQAGLQDETDATIVQAAQRVKRRKVMRMDNETELHNSQIKRQQEDRSAITKAPSFLPRDPLLLQLMELQRSGGFISNLMGDGRLQGWAPELRGILSLEVVRKAGDKKRKRDSGIADVETDEDRQATPQLEIPDDLDAGLGGDDSVPFGSDGLQALADDRLLDEDDETFGGAQDDFYVTEIPLLHPSQAGPVALGTKKMVHLLRDHFAPDHPKEANEPPTPSKRNKSSALFTELCPERQTTRQDATKMFFELLVLGTKDAIKVEQESKELGMPIRVRGKRGLWGDWAEMQSGGEIASQEEQPAREVAVEV